MTPQPGPAPAAPARVVCVGIAVLDRIYRVASLPDGPGKRFATGFLEAGGGPAASAAVAIARLGGAAALWARIGDDAAGAAIRAGLVAEHVEAGFLRACPGARSVTAAILVDPAGERSIVSDLDPALPTDAAWLPLDQLDRAGALLADCRWPEGAGAALAAAAARGVPAVLDADTIPDPAAARPLIALASHVIFSAPGLAQASGTADPQAGLLAMRPRTQAWLAVTLGGAGTLSLEEGGVRHWPARPVAVVDTTGAGDAFHGAFALALAERQPLAAAIRFAAGAAALACTRPGGRAGLPDRTELTHFLNAPAQEQERT
ncbi:MAG: ribokinase [Rhodospirillales bacterium]|nr:ribokinase [Rhodospirillales bacterium]